METHARREAAGTTKPLRDTASSSMLHSRCNEPMQHPLRHHYSAQAHHHDLAIAVYGGDSQQWKLAREVQLLVTGAPFKKTVASKSEGKYP